MVFFCSSRRRHTRYWRDWSSDVCSSDLKYAAVVATGRSDLPNQINNVLAFPGVFRGAIDAGATSITKEMMLAAATAIADVVGDDVRADYVVPSPLDRRVADAVATAVAACARDQGVTR